MFVIISLVIATMIDEPDERRKREAKPCGSDDDFYDVNDDRLNGGM